MPDNHIRIYTPDSSIVKPGQLFKEIVQGFKEGRFLARRLYIRNLRAQYRQSVLGLFWAFFPPLVNGLVWIFLQEQRVFSVGATPIPYPAFVLIGTILWQVFLDSVNIPMGTISGSKIMMTKINFPKEALLLTSLYQIGGNFLIKIVLLIGVYIWFSITPNWTTLLAFPGIFLMIIFGMGLSLCLTPLSMLYGDVKKTLTIVLQFLFFLTPIIYPMPEEGAAKVIAEINPVSPFILTIRDWITTGTASDLSGFFLSGFLGMLLFIFGVLLYRIAMPIIIERIGS